MNFGFEGAGIVVEASALFTYMATLAALTLAPGPLVAVLAARAANSDRGGAFALALGICLGDILLIVAICGGLGFWLQAHPEAFAYSKYLGVAFLLWMAVRMWHVPDLSLDRPIEIPSIVASGVAGFAICLSSPQTVVMYLVLLPQVTDMTMIGISELILLILATLIALAGVFLAVIFLAQVTQKFLGSAAGKLLWTRSMSLSVGLSALWIGFW